MKRQDFLNATKRIRELTGQIHLFEATHDLKKRDEAAKELNELIGTLAAKAKDGTLAIED